MLAVATSAVVLDRLFRDHLISEADAELKNQMVQLIALTRPTRSGSVDMIGQLADPRYARPFSGWAWQIRKGDEVLFQSGSLGPLIAGGVPILNAPPFEAGVFAGPFGQKSRGLARDIAPPLQVEKLTFAVARPQAEIDDALARFGAAIVGSISVLGAGLGATIAALIHGGLKPLLDLRARVTALRYGAATPERAWPQEIAPVVEELDALGDHVARLVQRARTGAADLAHAIKTPLAVIQQQCEILPNEAAEPIRRQSERIRVFLERHLSLSRSSGVAIGLVDVARCVNEVRFALASDLARRDVTLELDVSYGAAFIGDESDFYELIGNPLQNVTKWARRHVQLCARVADGRLAISISDDGPGIPADRRADLLQRGRRLDEHAPGHGLGLAIVDDLVALYGGAWSLRESAEGGLLVALSLPGLSRQEIDPA